MLGRFLRGATCLSYGEFLDAKQNGLRPLVAFGKVHRPGILLSITILKLGGSRHAGFAALTRRIRCHESQQWYRDLMRHSIVSQKLHAEPICPG